MKRHYGRCLAMVPSVRMRARSAGVVLSAAIVGACDPAATDAAYWERARTEGAGGAAAGSGGDDGSSTTTSTPSTSTAPDSVSTGAPPTACASISLTTISYGGHYEPDNVGAVWITDDSGAFVRTLERWGSRRLKHAVAWRASSNGNEVDAITGATEHTHVAHDVVWDCRDAGGAVRDSGAFQVHAEFTEEDSAERDPPGPHRVVPIDLAIPGPVDAPDDAGYRDVRIVVRP